MLIPTRRPSPPCCTDYVWAKQRVHDCSFSLSLSPPSPPPPQLPSTPHAHFPRNTHPTSPPFPWMDIIFGCFGFLCTSPPRYPNFLPSTPLPLLCCTEYERRRKIKRPHLLRLSFAPPKIQEKQPASRHISNNKNKQGILLSSKNIAKNEEQVARRAHARNSNAINNNTSKKNSSSNTLLDYRPAQAGVRPFLLTYASFPSPLPCRSRPLERRGEGRRRNVPTSFLLHPSLPPPPPTPSSLLSITPPTHPPFTSRVVFFFLAARHS